MSESPLFTQHDADRILQRAAEIEGNDEGHAMSVRDLRGIAGEAGFGAGAVERAIAEALEFGGREGRPAPVEVEYEGFIFAKMWTLRTIPIELSSDQMLRAVRLFQPYLEGPARISLEDRRISWRDRKGVIFHLESSRGQTEIRVRLSKFVIRRERMKGWIRSAADRLEALVYLVAARDHSALPSTSSD